jgi:ABC-type Na+ efflux pump permease subunit
LGNRDPRLTIARRDLSALSREKTIVLALLIQLFVAAFSSFLVVGLTSLYSPDSVSAEVTVGVSGDERQDLVAAAREQEGVAVEVYDSREAAREAFQRTAGPRPDALLHASSAGERVNVTATVPDGSIETTLVVVQVKEILERLERTERIQRSANLENQPVPVPPDVDASQYFGFTYTILLPLLLFLPPFISGSVAVDAVTEEIERGTLELLRVSPVTLTDIVDGKALGMILIAPIQAVAWMLLLGVNGTSVANLPSLVAFVTALSTVVVVVGIVFGLAMGDRRRAQLAYSTGVLLVFGLAVLLPQHPATVIALLAVDSATVVTYASVAGFLALAVALYAGARAYARRLNPERFA